MTSVAHLVIGPDRHGVVQFALRIRDGITDAGLDSTLLRHESASDVTAIPDVEVVHLHVTDRLFGSPATAAAAVVEDLARRIHASGSAFVVTLHDLPQPSDGRSASARVECYRRVVACADTVIVSSEHERDLVGAAGIETPEPSVVIPLPVATGAGVRTSSDEVTVGVLGFLYPGKGHAEVLDALPPGAHLRALGTPSPGHDHLVDELAEAAAAHGTTVRVTGYIDDADLPVELGRVTVPVAHHRHMSASGSINTWIEHGRRPLVVAGAYTREFARRSPGTVTLYEEDRLAEALADAVREPASTWLEKGVIAHPTSAEVGAAHVRVYAALAESAVVHA
ncbi:MULTISPECIES: glycosyltransferase [Nocardiaceae]|uniref:Glycosyltransferase involved in cell wall biosynthesis n=1 Tax=Rhodococcoides corynebacterioides TaxID=53972 RepID=A0ABS2KVZ4_9NOCA|nr:MULTISPECIES: glycosyltransferase [Rhodococcus]MBM7416096.1 glycosyltransferase involved in cell wall biosynthesis [Rhodococcus corynebacterioides]MBP1114349.1 glycosyltransferase involved in cell wall biosynthesis [Rhodococcus sp. PvP016]